MASFDPPRDLDDEVFVGPVTQRELIITWRKRRQARLERERAEALKNEENCSQPSRVDGEEPDVKKLRVHSEEREVNLEVTNDEQPSENTSNSYKTAGQASDCQSQDTRTDCTSIEEEGTEDNIFQIDHSCVVNESKETSSVEDVSIVDHLSKIQGESASGPMAMFTKPADILREDEETFVSEQSENHEEAIEESPQLVAGSIRTQSKDASYSSIEESINEKCNELPESEVELVAEQALVKYRGDETSTDDLSEMCEMSVDEVGLLNAVMDTPSKPSSEDISIHDKSIENEDTEVRELIKNETDVNYTSQNSATIAQQSVQENDQKPSKEASFIDGVSITSMCSEIQETEASIEPVEHESECAVLEEPLPPIKDSLGKLDVLLESPQLVAGSVRLQSKEASYSSIGESINEKCNELQENELELVAEQALVKYRGDATSTDDQSEICEMSVDEVGLLNAVMDTPKTVPSSEDISIHDKSIENEDTEVEIIIHKNKTDVNYTSQDSPTIAQQSVQQNDQKPSKEASFIDGVSITSICSEIQETEASIESVDHESECAVLEEPLPPIKNSLGKPEVLLESPQLVAGSVRTQSKEASYSTIDESINEKCNELSENELELVAEQALVKYRGDATSTDDQSEICEMSVDVIAVMDSPKTVPSSEDISIHDKSIENEDTEVKIIINKNKTDVNYTSQNSPTIAQQSVQQNDQKPSKEASFIDGVSITSMCSEIQETEASIESVDHESECAVLEEPLPPIKNSLGKPEVLLESPQLVAGSIRTQSKEASYSSIDESINEKCNELEENELELVAEEPLVEYREDETSSDDQSEIYEMPVDDSDYQPLELDSDRICASSEIERDVENSVSHIDNNCSAKKDVSFNENMSEVQNELVSGQIVISADYNPEESMCLFKKCEDILANGESDNYEEALEDSDYQLQDNDKTCTSVEKEAAVEDNIFQTDNNWDANESKEAPSVKDVSISENSSEIRGKVSDAMSTNYSPNESVSVLQEDEETSANDKSGNYEEAVEELHQPNYLFLGAPTKEASYSNEDMSSRPEIRESMLEPIAEQQVPIEHKTLQSGSAQNGVDEASVDDQSEIFEMSVEEFGQLSAVVLETPSKAAPAAEDISFQDKSSENLEPEVQHVTSVDDKRHKCLMTVQDSVQLSAAALETLPKAVPFVEDISIHDKSLENQEPEVQHATSVGDKRHKCLVTVQDSVQLSAAVLETLPKAAPSAEDVSIHDKSSENQEPEVQHVTSVDDKRHRCLMTVQDSVQLSAATDLEQQSIEVSPADDTSIFNSCSDNLETESVSRLASIESVEHESDCALIDEPKSSIEDSLGKSAVTMPCHQHSEVPLAHKAPTTDDIPVNHRPEENKENGPSLVLDSPPVMPEVRPSKMIGPPRTGTVPRSNIPKPTILKPATLNVDQSSLDTAWVKRINMSKIPKPKRPFYVQPPDK